MSGEQLDLLRLEMHRVHGDQPRAEQSKPAQALQRAHGETLPAVLDFLHGLVQVQVQWQLDLFGQRQHLHEAAVGNRIRSMRGEAERQQWLAEEAVARGESLGQVVIRVGRIVAREVDGDETDGGADSRCQRRLRRRRREEVHVVENR
jgi:hypothetical protein